MRLEGKEYVVQDGDTSSSASTSDPTEPEAASLARADRDGGTQFGRGGGGHARAVLTVDGREVAPLEVAATRRARGRGLLGRDGVDGALWLPGVRSVHTVGMRFALDVAWVDRAGRVLRTRTMAPRRASTWVPRAAGVLEAEAGAFVRWGLVPGVVAGPGVGTRGCRPPGREPAAH